MFSKVSWRLKLFKHFSWVGTEGIGDHMYDLMFGKDSSEICLTIQVLQKSMQTTALEIRPYIGMNNHFPFITPALPFLRRGGGASGWGRHSFAWPYALILMKTPRFHVTFQEERIMAIGCHWPPFPIGGDTHTAGTLPRSSSWKNMRIKRFRVRHVDKALKETHFLAWNFGILMKLEPISPAAETYPLCSGFL